MQADGKLASCFKTTTICNADPTPLENGLEIANGGGSGGFAFHFNFGN